MMFRLIPAVLAAALVLPLPAWAGPDQPSRVEPEELEKACLKMACRRDVHVELRRDDGSVFKSFCAGGIEGDRLLSFGGLGRDEGGLPQLLARLSGEFAHVTLVHQVVAREFDPGGG